MRVSCLEVRGSLGGLVLRGIQQLKRHLPSSHEDQMDAGKAVGPPKIPSSQ